MKELYTFLTKELKKEFEYTEGSFVYSPNIDQVIKNGGIVSKYGTVVRIETLELNASKFKRLDGFDSDASQEFAKKPNIYVRQPRYSFTDEQLITIFKQQDKIYDFLMKSSNPFTTMDKIPLLLEKPGLEYKYKEFMEITNKLLENTETKSCKEPDNYVEKIKTFWQLREEYTFLKEKAAQSGKYTTLMDDFFATNLKEPMSERVELVYSKRYKIKEMLGLK